MRRRLRNWLNLAAFFWVQRTRGFDVPDAPLFDPAAAAFFRARLAESRGYLEYGSGGSTLAADRAGVPTVSVEGDAFYARSVARRLSAGTRVTMLPVDIGLTGFWGLPIFRTPTPARLRAWRSYVDAPFRDPSARPFPDFVLVDGRFRRACALKAVHEAQRRGATVTVMIDDYTDGRDHYAAIEPILGAPALHGRAAVFESAAASPVSEAAIAEAARDFR